MLLHSITKMLFDKKDGHIACFHPNLAIKSTTKNRLRKKYTCCAAMLLLPKNLTLFHHETIIFLMLKFDFKVE